MTEVVTSTLRSSSGLGREQYDHEESWHLPLRDEDAEIVGSRRLSPTASTYMIGGPSAIAARFDVTEQALSDTRCAGGIVEFGLKSSPWFDQRTAA